MKCDQCGEEITLTIFGAPSNLCWGCLNPKEKEIVVKENVLPEPRQSRKIKRLELEKKADAYLDEKYNPFGGSKKLREFGNTQARALFECYVAGYCQSTLDNEIK